MERTGPFRVIVPFWLSVLSAITVRRSLRVRPRSAVDWAWMLKLAKLNRSAHAKKALRELIDIFTLQQAGAGPFCNCKQAIRTELRFSKD